MGKNNSYLLKQKKKKKTEYICLFQCVFFKYTYLQQFESSFECPKPSLMGSFQMAKKNRWRTYHPPFLTTPPFLQKSFNPPFGHFWWTQSLYKLKVAGKKKLFYMILYTFLILVCLFFFFFFDCLIVFLTWQLFFFLSIFEESN